MLSSLRSLLGPKRALACSFCGRSAREVTALLAGPHVFICEGCVDACNDILARERGRRR